MYQPTWKTSLEKPIISRHQIQILKTLGVAQKYSLHGVNGIKKRSVKLFKKNTQPASTGLFHKYIFLPVLTALFKVDINMLLKGAEEHKDLLLALSPELCLFQTKLL